MVIGTQHAPHNSRIARNIQQQMSTNVKSSQPMAVRRRKLNQSAHRIIGIGNVQSVEWNSTVQALLMDL